MTTSIEHVNDKNAKSTELLLRVLEPVCRKIENKDMDVFTCQLVGRSGQYTSGEAMIFGTPAQRLKLKTALEKKFEKNQVYLFSKMTMRKKNNQFVSSPHEYIVNLGDKNLVCNKKTDKDACAIPEEAEPPMSPGDLLDLPTGQLVDTHAVVTVSYTHLTLPTILLV